MENYFGTEKLDGDNMFFCGKCDRKRDALAVLKPKKFS